MPDFSELGYLGLFIASFLSSTVVPFASEGILGVMVASGYHLWACIIIATIGNSLGSYTTYGLGYLGKTEWLEKYFGLNDKQRRRAEEMIKKYGTYSALVSWLPVLGDAIAIVLGLFKTPITLTFSLIAIGKFFRYIVIAFFVLQIF